MEIRREDLLPETLAVEIPAMDVQHEQIFVHLEALKQACFGNSHLPAEEFKQLLNALEQHFIDEEHLALDAGIEFSRHAEVHKDNIVSLKDTLDIVLTGLSDPYSFLRYMEFWFERHIVQWDKPFANQLRRVIQRIDSGTERE